MVDTGPNLFIRLGKYDPAANIDDQKGKFFVVCDLLVALHGIQV